MSAESYMRTLTHLEGTEQWNTAVHSFRRSIAICDEEHNLYDQGASVALVGYCQDGTVAAGYSYVLLNSRYLLNLSCRSYRVNKPKFQRIFGF